MRFDEQECLIREKYPLGHIANYGDSMAETSRLAILEHVPLYGLHLTQFFNPDGIGYVRHPILKDIPEWDETDVSGDQFFALYMALRLQTSEQVKYVANVSGTEWKVPGTNKWLTPAAWFLIRGHYRMLNVCNIVQGWLFKMKYRIADGGRIEKSYGQVQDYLNYICTYIFLKKMNKRATLNVSKEACFKAVTKYYLEGDDFEPNSDWIVQIYKRNLEVP